MPWPLPADGLRHQGDSRSPADGTPNSLICWAMRSRTSPTPISQAGTAGRPASPLLQTALLVTVTLAVPATQGPATGPSSKIRTSTIQPDLARCGGGGHRDLRSVFHELLLRGYGRKLEMERTTGAGARALAGYPREAGEGLLRNCMIGSMRTESSDTGARIPTSRIGWPSRAARGVDHGPGDAGGGGLPRPPPQRPGRSGRRLPQRRGLRVSLRARPAGRPGNRDQPRRSPRFPAVSAGNAGAQAAPDTGLWPH